MNYPMKPEQRNNDQQTEVRHVFLLSPARCDGKRAQLLYSARARFELAMKLRTPQGAPLGEIFSFLSGLYFRGKLAYARAFAKPPAGISGCHIITTNRGLLDPDEMFTLADLRRMGSCAIDAQDRRYHAPLKRDLRALSKRCMEDCQFVLLGSIASAKYVRILTEILGPRLLFPGEFVGRGDMSRGGLMLRCVEENRELTYLPVHSSTLHGKRPAKLEPKPGILSRVGR